jgi:hypothetical protein
VKEADQVHRLVQEARLPLVEVPAAKTVRLVAGLHLGGVGSYGVEETRRRGG